jgi:hypothetical protein
MHTGKGWTTEEEKLIGVRGGEHRLKAIHDLRRRWLIGTTRPPMYRGRMPKANPNWRP